MGQNEGLQSSINQMAADGIRTFALQQLKSAELSQLHGRWRMRQVGNVWHGDPVLWVIGVFHMEASRNWIQATKVMMSDPLTVRAKGQSDAARGMEKAAANPNEP